MCLCGQCATATTYQILSSDSTAHLQVALCSTYEAYTIDYLVFTQRADPSGHAVQGLGLRPLYCWNGWCKSRWGHGCLTCYCCVLLGGCPCDRPITRPEKPHRVWRVCYFKTSTGRPEPYWAVEKNSKVNLASL